MTSIADWSIDDALLSPEFFANPYPLYHRLRVEAPVYRSEAWGGWVLTRYADVVNVLRRPDRFSSAGRVTYLLNQLPPEVRARAGTLEGHYQVGLAHSNPPDHTRLRALFRRTFTPRAIDGLRPRIQALTDELLDRVQPTGRMDVIGDLAYPLPATLIAGLIGAPPQDRDQFRRWALDINTLFSGGGRVTPDSMARAQQTLLAMRDYITDLVAERRRHPQRDIISDLVLAAQQGQRISPAELISSCVTLFVAGHETTTYLIGNAILALLRNPDQLELLLRDPNLIEPAVEELLRYDTSVQRGWRIAATDVEIDGQRIVKGELVMPMLGAANRDPAQFPDPDRLDIQRSHNKHITFGYGIHFCLGAPLARLEIPIVIATILRRIPGLRLADQATLVWRHDVALRGLEALPVIF